MSALPSEADIGAVFHHVSFVPISEVEVLFDTPKQGSEGLFAGLSTAWSHAAMDAAPRCLGVFESDFESDPLM
jgi:hypothetical protein